MPTNSCIGDFLACARQFNDKTLAVKASPRGRATTIGLVAQLNGAKPNNARWRLLFLTNETRDAKWIIGSWSMAMCLITKSTLVIPKLFYFAQGWLGKGSPEDLLSSVKVYGMTIECGGRTQPSEIDLALMILFITNAKFGRKTIGHPQKFLDEHPVVKRLRSEQLNWGEAIVKS